MRNRCVFCGVGLDWGTCYGCGVMWFLASPADKEAGLPTKTKGRGEAVWKSVPDGCLLVREGREG